MSSNSDLKSNIRTEILARRDRLSPEDRAAFSLTAADHFKAYIDHKDNPLTGGDIISAFLPIKSEIDLMPLVDMLWLRKIPVCLPALLNRTVMAFRAYHANSEIVASGFGTSAPTDSAQVLVPTIMLVPLAAFDQIGNRIGYGAGHYDRAIARQTAKGQKPKLIGVAFSCQEVTNIPSENHDVPLDMILTEHGLRSF